MLFLLSRSLWNYLDSDCYNLQVEKKSETILNCNFWPFFHMLVCQIYRFHCHRN